MLYELSIGAIFRNEAPYFKEWIDYHRRVGVEHFWLYNDKSTDNWEEVLKPYIDQNIVEVIDWPVPTWNDFVACQVAAYKDVLRRTSEVTRWLALIDIDEFMLPMVEKSVAKCLDKHYSKASAVFVNWFCFGTGHVTLHPGQSVLQHLTACGDKYHFLNSVGKSIVRPDHIDIDAVWYPHHFVPFHWAKYYNGDGQEIQMVNNDLKVVNQFHTRYLRINHYIMRDETFFWNVKLPRAEASNNGHALLRYYDDLNTRQDTTIIRFLER